MESPLYITLDGAKLADGRTCYVVPGSATRLRIVELPNFAYLVDATVAPVKPTASTVAILGLELLGGKTLRLDATALFRGASEAIAVHEQLELEASKLDARGASGPELADFYGAGLGRVTDAFAAGIVSVPDLAPVG